MNRLQIIAGPCSAESEQQIWDTAQQLRSMGINTLRVGVWKPRSRANTFAGAGEISFTWIRKIQSELGLKVMVEVALPCHVETALKHGIDALWIGARTTANPFMVQELASVLRGSSTPVFIKNPICPDFELWTGTIERFLLQGISNLSLIHRGFFMGTGLLYRNQPLWEQTIPFLRSYPDVPIYCDPSHMAGKKQHIEPIIRQALQQNLTWDGLFIESHIDPLRALSDADQQLSPAELQALIHRLDIQSL